VIKAIEAARAQGMKVITLTGKDGGKMAGSADVEIRVPHFGYADRIQEIHIKVIHILIMLIEKEMVKKANRQVSVLLTVARSGAVVICEGEVIYVRTARDERQCANRYLL
jgi:D-arabinose 5-phosphate isomerase GutQ